MTQWMTFGLNDQDAMRDLTLLLDDWQRAMFSLYPTWQTANWLGHA